MGGRETRKSTTSPPIPRQSQTWRLSLSEKAASGAPHSPRFRTAWERTVRINPRLNSCRGILQLGPLCEQRRDCVSPGGPRRCRLRAGTNGDFAGPPFRGCGRADGRTAPAAPMSLGHAASAQMPGRNRGAGNPIVGSRGSCEMGDKDLIDHTARSRASDLSGPPFPLPG